MTTRKAFVHDLPTGAAEFQISDLYLDDLAVNSHSTLSVQTVQPWSNLLPLPTLRDNREACLRLAFSRANSGTREIERLMEVLG